MVYVKYNRLENLKEILHDSRLDFLGEDFKNYYNVFDYLSFLALKSTKSENFQNIENVVFNYYLQNYFPRHATENVAALNAKYDGGKKIG